MSLPLVLVGLGYGAYLLYAYAAGTLSFYINPTYIIPTAVTGAVLVALGAICAIAPRDRRGLEAQPPHAGHAGDPTRGGPSWLALAVLAFPLVLGFGLPARPLGISTAAQRGVEAVPLGRIDEAFEFRVNSRPEGYSIKDWVTAMQADPDPGSLVGKPVRVSGFVYRDSRVPDGWFLVARFVVQCCAVDATPIGLPVRAADGSVPKDGAWVAVEGVWEVTEVRGGRKAVIAPASVTPIARPDQPYLY